MAFRKPISTDLGRRMNSSPSSRLSMNSSTSKGFTAWVNKDIREVAETGDWSVLLEKARKQTTRFRNDFYGARRA